MAEINFINGEETENGTGEGINKKYTTIDWIAFGCGLCVDAIVAALLTRYVPVSKGIVNRLVRKVGIIVASAVVCDITTREVKKDLEAMEGTFGVCKKIINAVNNEEEEVVINA